MADYKTILRDRPSYGDYLPDKSLIHRGDVLAFQPNIRRKSFSTDPQGFRHTSFGGESLAVAQIVKRERYALLLGTSRTFGSALEGNDKTIPSVLSERLGVPFANIALPQGSSRNLHSILLTILLRAPTKPSVVIHFSTGDLTGLTYSSFADPVLGSPSPKHLQILRSERGKIASPEPYVSALLGFTSLWTRAIAELCASHRIPLVLGHDSSFFEKRQPSARDRAWGLGVPHTAYDRFWFANHKLIVERFYQRRELLAKRFGVPLIGPGLSNDLTFVDEFHYDEDGARASAEEFVPAIQPLLQR